MSLSQPHRTVRKDSRIRSTSQLCIFLITCLEGVMSTSFSPPVMLNSSLRLCCFALTPNHIFMTNSRICLFCLKHKGLLKENITFSYHFLQPIRNRVLAGTINSRQTVKVSVIECLWWRRCQLEMPNLDPERRRESRANQLILWLAGQTWGTFLSVFRQL